MDDTGYRTAFQALRWLALALLCSACNRSPGSEQYLHSADHPSAAVAQLSADAAPRPIGGKSTSTRANDRNDGTLAYEHRVDVELPSEAIATRIDELRNACESHQDLACSVLDVSVSADRNVPSGQVRLRLSPRGVEAMIAIAARGARIASQNTHAEDLAEPIADTDRELALLTTHRDRLNEFLGRKDLKVEQEISLSREISSTQMQIDTLNTQKANLRRRVDTDLLSVQLEPPRSAYGAHQTPIRDALGSFGIDFRTAIAQVIRFVAALVPWLVVIVPGIVLLRLLWRTITRWLAQRERLP